MSRILSLAILVLLTKVFPCCTKGIIAKVYSEVITVTVFNSTPELAVDESSSRVTSLTGLQEFRYSYSLLDQPSVTQSSAHICELLMKIMRDVGWNVTGDVISVTILLHKALYHKGFYTLSDYVVNTAFRNYFERSSARKILYHQQSFDEFDSTVWKYIWYNYNNKVLTLPDDATISRDPSMGLVLSFPTSTNKVAAQNTTNESKILPVEYLQKNYSLFGIVLKNLSDHLLFTDGLDSLLELETNIEAAHPCFQQGYTVSINRTLLAESTSPPNNKGKKNLDSISIVAFKGSEQWEKCVELLSRGKKLTALVQANWHATIKYIHSLNLLLPKKITLITTNEDYINRCHHNYRVDFKIVEGDHELKSWNCSLLLSAYDRVVVNALEKLTNSNTAVLSRHADLKYPNLGNLLTTNPIYKSSVLAPLVDGLMGTPTKPSNENSPTQQTQNHSEHTAKLPNKKSSALIGVTIGLGIVLMFTAWLAILVRRRYRIRRQRY